MSDEATLLVLLLAAGAAAVLFLRRTSEIRIKQKSPEIGTREKNPRPEPSSGLVPVTHPMIRRAAESALRKGNDAAKYIVKQGDEIYFSFEALDDEAERQRAVDLMTRIQAGENAEMAELMWFVRRVFK